VLLKVSRKKKKRKINGLGTIAGAGVDEVIACRRAPLPFLLALSLLDLGDDAVSEYGATISS
jgi:hypothetical protein